MRPEEKIPYVDTLNDFEREEKLPFFTTHAGKVISALIMVVVIIIIMAMQAGGGSAAYEMDDTQLAVACLDRLPVFIPYDTITNVQVAETFAMDRTIESTDWNSGWCGTYENEEYGEFTLYAYSTCGIYIVVEHEDGVLIFNAKNQKETNAAYEELIEKWGNENGQKREILWPQ